MRDLSLSKEPPCKRQAAAEILLGRRIFADASSKVLQRDEKAQEHAPKVMRDDKATSSPKGSRPFSTSTRRRAELTVGSGTTSLQGYGEGQGHIFGLPTLPLPSGSHMKHRYDPVVTQVTKLIMQDGKLSVAQRVWSP